MRLIVVLLEMLDDTLLGEELIGLLARVASNPIKHPNDFLPVLAT